jgi:HD-GYP domain-containing protein (c-di-GMP phosphodiesterase class II)
MNIKERFKLSFIVVIFTVLFIGFVAVFVTFFIRKNLFLNNQISQIILLQERMNQTIIDITLTKTIADIDELKDRFIQSEKAFEKIKASSALRKNYGVMRVFLNEKVEQKQIVKKLEKLFINEHKLEESFFKMYAMQENYIDLEKKFKDLYPQEEKERDLISKKILSKKDFQTIYDFERAQYYSKETLYQYKTYRTLSLWLGFIDSAKNRLSDKKLIKKLENYKIVAQKIGTDGLKLDRLQKDKLFLQKEIGNVLQVNKQLANEISMMIESMSTKITNILFFVLMTVIIFVAIFLVFFGVNALKNVGLSVDEIEVKVKDGLKQITELNTEIESTQKEIIFTMGTIAEYRSKETGNHVKRVAEYSKILALHYGLDETETEMLKQASPMHDIGKVAIPDAVLNKPGRFDEQERKIMNTHAFLGYEMLKKSKRPLLKTASIVAYEHHEKWDGSGYPRGLNGEEIHIYGRITALADVFDALGSDRVYKKAWDNEKIFELFKQERGKHFEPKLVDIFFDNLDEFLKIQQTFKDV